MITCIYIYKLNAYVILMRYTYHKVPFSEDKSLDDEYINVEITT